MLGPFSVYTMVLADKELGKDVVWTEYRRSAIKCVDVAIFAAYMLTFVSDSWCKASRSIARYLGHCRWPDLPDRCVFGLA